MDVVNCKAHNAAGGSGYKAGSVEELGEMGKVQEAEIERQSDVL